MVEGEERPASDEVLPLEFEAVRRGGAGDGLPPQYVQSRILRAAQAAAPSTGRIQKAMKSATDNADG